MRYCSHCGKAIADQAVICVNCGCRTGVVHMPPIQPSVVPRGEVTGHEFGLANWAQICGIVSFFIGWFALGITAIVLACMSKEENAGTMSQPAKVGYVCGIISTTLSLLALVMFIAVITALSL